VLFQLGVEGVAGLQELALLLDVLVLNLGELGRELLLVFCQVADLPLQDTHSRGRNHAPHVRDHCLGEYFVDEHVVAGESSMGQVFDAKAVIRVVSILGLLDVYPSFSGLGTFGFWVVNHRSVPRLLLLISLIGRRILVHRQLFVILRFLDIVFILEFLFLCVWELPPHQAQDLIHLPQMKVTMFTPNRVPNLLGEPHVGSHGLLRSFWRFRNAGTSHGSFVQSLWVECVVPVLCLDEGVAPGLVHLATALEVTKKAPWASDWT